MEWYHFILFIVLDSYIHYRLVKWEVIQNKDLFIVIEVPRRWLKNEKKE